MNEEIADLLQALEHTTEQTCRLSQVLRQSLEAQRDRRPLSDATVREYLQQLDTADADRQRMQERIRQFWTMLGKEQAH